MAFINSHQFTIFVVGVRESSRRDLHFTVWPLWPVQSLHIRLPVQMVSSEALHINHIHHNQQQIKQIWHCEHVCSYSSEYFRPVFKDGNGKYTVTTGLQRERVKLWCCHIPSKKVTNHQFCTWESSMNFMKNFHFLVKDESPILKTMKERFQLKWKFWNSASFFFFFWYIPFFLCFILF